MLFCSLLDVGAPAHEGQPPQINSQHVGNTKHCSSVVNLQIYYTAWQKHMDGFLVLDIKKTK